MSRSAFENYELIRIQNLNQFLCLTDDVVIVPLNRANDQDIRVLDLSNHVGIVGGNGNTHVGAEKVAVCNGTTFEVLLQIGCHGISEGVTKENDVLLVGGVCTGCGARIAYTVAGSDTLCGTSWDTNNTANDMEWDEAAGVYKKVYTNVSAGTYEFKVVQDHSWGVNWGQGGHGGGNFVVDVANNGATITIIFDGTTVTFEVK